ncbi:MAG: hypothetical protein Q8O81_16325, partial [Giesbergeria sp.]|nr:hypothetical protein [Giesbergeria sp.]
MQEVLEMTFAGNDVLAWARAALWIVGTVALTKFLLPVVIRNIARWAAGTTTRLDDAVVKALRTVRWWMVALVALYPASHELVVRAATTRWLASIATIAFFLQLALCASAFITA